MAPPSTGAPTTVGGAGPRIEVTTRGGVGVPAVVGDQAASAALGRVAAGLGPGCAPRTELDTARLVSVAWKCPGGRVAAASVEPGSGRLLGLGDLLSGDYAAYLSSVAAAQLQAQGVPNPKTDDLSVWFVSPGALAVVFAAGAVSYPLGSLAPYIDGHGPLAPTG